MNAEAKRYEVLRVREAQSAAQEAKQAERAKREARKAKQNAIQFPVIMAKGSHLFPSRTQKLSPSASKVPGWTRPGRIDHRRIPF